jgi:hypothetical protein
MHRITVALLGLALAVPIAYGTYAARLNYQGYCFAQEKYLTDDEKLRVAIAHELKRYPPSVEYHKPPLGKETIALGYYAQPLKPIYYHDVDEFLALNPGCCELKLKRSVEEPVLLFREWVTGAVTSFARITYQVRFSDKENSLQAIEHTVYPPLSNCGVPFPQPDMLFMDDLYFYYLAFTNRGTQ